MRLNAAAVVGDAWALFRRDRDLLLRVAGPFWFVPAFALALLIPAPPPRPAGSAGDATATLAWADSFAQWMTAQGPWYLLAWAIGALASATLFCWYLDGETADLRDALRRGARAWPRLMLVNAIVAVMAGAGLLLWVVPGLYVLGRMLPAAPALVAERPSAAVLAIGRAFWLSRGAGLSLMALTAATLGLGWVGGEPLLLLEGWLRTRPGGENVVAIALCDAVAAGVAAAAALAGVLLAVAAYRRLASKGI